MQSAAPYIRCDGLSKSYGSVQVIERLSLDIYPGEFVSLLGPSGSGKTTLLTMLAGFEHPTGGDIWLNGYKINDVPSFKRDMGVVFQNYALFPHMTIAQNVAFPLRMRGVSKSDIATKVARALDMVELAAHADKRPTQLSGGQQQRVALARALVFEPRVVLMDEPLGALDKRLREQMQLDIRALHKSLGLTVVFVTHDQSEALTMSDRIAVFNKGKIEQIAPPDDVYDRPNTLFVAEFIGETNILEGVVLGQDGTGSRVQVGDRVLHVAQTLTKGDTVAVSLRPERLKLSLTPDLPNGASRRITDKVYMGDHLRLVLDDGTIVRAGRQDDAFVPGMQVTAGFAPDDAWVVAK